MYRRFQNFFTACGQSSDNATNRIEERQNRAKKKSRQTQCPTLCENFKKRSTRELLAINTFAALDRPLVTGDCNDINYNLTEATSSQPSKTLSRFFFNLKSSTAFLLKVRLYSVFSRKDLSCLTSSARHCRDDSKLVRTLTVSTDTPWPLSRVFVDSSEHQSIKKAHGAIFLSDTPDGSIAEKASFSFRCAKTRSELLNIKMESCSVICSDVFPLPSGSTIPRNHPIKGDTKTSKKLDCCTATRDTHVILGDSSSIQQLCVEDSPGVGPADTLLTSATRVSRIIKPLYTLYSNKNFTKNVSKSIHSRQCVASRILLNLTNYEASSVCNLGSSLASVDYELGLCQWCSTVLTRFVFDSSSMRNSETIAAVLLPMVNAYDRRIMLSYRTPECNVSEQQFWEEIYAREEKLIIRPFNSELGVLSQLFLYSGPCSASEKIGLLNASCLKDRKMPFCSRCCQNCNLTLSDAYFTERNRLFTDVPEQQRSFAVQWMKRVTRKMNWKHSTYYVAVHAFDAFTASSSHKDLAAPLSRNGVVRSYRNDPCSCFNSKHVKYRSVSNHSYVSETKDINLSVVAIAALCLAVVAGEDHTQAVRVQKLFVGTSPCIIAQLNAVKLHILCRLTRGLLITRTPEDFLYYFLANMKSSEHFGEIYSRLLFACSWRSGSSNSPDNTATLEMKHRRTKGNKLDIVIENECKSLTGSWETYHNGMCWLSTLPGTIRLVLFGTSLAFETGLYRSFRCSVLTAAILLATLAAGCCPELCSNAFLVTKFYSDVCRFANQHDAFLAIQRCSAALLNDTQKAFERQSISIFPATAFGRVTPRLPVSFLLQQLVVVLRQWSNLSVSKPFATWHCADNMVLTTEEFESQNSMAKTTASENSRSYTDSQCSTLEEISVTENST